MVIAKQVTIPIADNSLLMQFTLPNGKFTLKYFEVTVNAITDIDTLFANGRITFRVESSMDDQLFPLTKRLTSLSTTFEDELDHRIFIVPFRNETRIIPVERNMRENTEIKVFSNSSYISTVDTIMSFWFKEY